jgi:hypothetical protein
LLSHVHRDLTKRYYSVNSLRHTVELERCTATASIPVTNLVKLTARGDASIINSLPAARHQSLQSSTVPNPCCTRSPSPSSLSHLPGRFPLQTWRSSWIPPTWCSASSVGLAAPLRSSQSDTELQAPTIGSGRKPCACEIPPAMPLPSKLVQSVLGCC